MTTRVDVSVVDAVAEKLDRLTCQKSGSQEVLDRGRLPAIGWESRREVRADTPVRIELPEAAGSEPGRVSAPIGFIPWGRVVESARQRS